MRIWTALLAVVAIINCLSCSRPAERPAEPAVEAPEWEIVLPGLMDETQKAQHELALAAVNAMMSETMGELEAALEAGGPAEGIAVCRDKAPEIAARVGDQFGVRIGRTSFALRNASNLPPSWARPQVTAKVDDPIFLAGPYGELGALLPIRLKPECQMCHGPREAIADDVLAAISESYPHDQAVGFTNGDLRGWFWIEIPGEPPDADL
jgi:hypothetical protein